MQSNRPRDTKPEIRVRSALHRAGLRFRKHVRPLPALRCTADVVFPSERVAVFIDGCFWHSCPIHGGVPVTNGDWWRAKLDATRERDRTNALALYEAGWTVVRVWEHDDIQDVVAYVRDQVSTSRRTRGKTGPRK